MLTRFPPSRQRFEQFKAELHERNNQTDGGLRKQRERSSFELVASFFRLLHGHRFTVALSLVTLTVATALSLLPPAATKFIVDYVLGGKPLPAKAPAWIPRDPWLLLLTITVVVVVISLVKIAVHLWGRWHATRVTKLLQMSVRKKVFAHAVRLPMHRVQELKSGGAASVLRQDAGSVGELVFGMLYDPWRAVIQLVGSLCVLAWVDVRLLLGALVVVPLVYFTHRTWIGSIRPQHRRIRATRGSRCIGHGVLWRHAGRAGVRAAAFRDEPHHARQPRYGSARTVCLVVDARD